MAQLTIKILSLWEIAHRWHDQDPNTSDPKKLNLNVQDTLRHLTRAAYDHKLTLCSKTGLEIGNNSHYEFMGDPMKDEEDRDRYNDDYENWLVYLERKTAQHELIVKDFLRSFNNRIYDKKTLDGVFTGRRAVADFCVVENISAPQFWFSQKEVTDIGKGKIGVRGHYYVDPQNDELETINKKNQFEGRHGQSKLDRELCRAIASTLWLEHPTMTITEVTKHKAIQLYGNGKLYEGPETLRNWIRDLDPRPKEEKIGRPKKAQTDN